MCGHKRKNSVNLFLRFQSSKETDARALMRLLAEDGTTIFALKQRRWNDPHAETWVQADAYAFHTPVS